MRVSAPDRGGPSRRRRLPSGCPRLPGALDSATPSAPAHWRAGARASLSCPDLPATRAPPPPGSGASPVCAAAGRKPAGAAQSPRGLGRGRAEGAESGEGGKPCSLKNGLLLASGGRVGCQTLSYWLNSSDGSTSGRVNFPNSLPCQSVSPADWQGSELGKL